MAYLYSDGNIPGTIKALETLLEQYPELDSHVDLVLLSESSFETLTPQAMLASDVLIFDMMNEQLLAQYNAQHGVDLLQQIPSAIAIGQGLSDPSVFADQGALLDKRAQAYWTHSGAQNRLALLKFALNTTGLTDFKLPEPKLSLDFGFYYPEGPDGQVFATWQAFDAWREAHGKKTSGPRVAVGFYKADYYNGDTALLDAVVAEIERQGGQAIPAFGYPGAVAFEALLRNSDGSPRADVALAGNMHFSDGKAAGILDTVDIPIVSLISLYGRSEAEWRASEQGLSTFEATFNLGLPELAGTTAPTVVGTKEKVARSGLTSVVTRPVVEQVEKAVSRAIRLAGLRSRPNAEKRLALIYYNYPAGQANIGASYLNVADSLARVLERFAQQGYDVGPNVPSQDQLIAEMTTKARNIIADAPGELETMVDAGNAALVGVDDYKTWLATYAPTLQSKILADWGKPGEQRLMMLNSGQRQSFVIPHLRYGNIVVMPQPARGWGEDLEQLYHAKDLSPPHQYFAAYHWIKHDFDADAVVHIGTHGTLEWLDGKATGLNDEDAPDALIGDLPHAYIYNVDVVGEGLVARRRGAATIVDHMVPPFVKGALTEDLAELSELVNDHHHNEAKNPELHAAYQKRLEDKLRDMGILKDMGLDPSKPISHATMHEVEDYLAEIKNQLIPYGMHGFGRTPDFDGILSTVDAVVSADRSLLPGEREILAKDMASRIKRSAPQELSRLMETLNGRFIPTGIGGEPVRNPDAYPTGKNFIGIDPNKVPKQAAYALGIEMADKMLADHLAEHGKYPEKVSFVIWGNETIRHEGVLESQIFHLLGTKPVWDARGKVVDVEIIDRAELGRPRIDIVIASASEGLFSNLTQLMDTAVQRVKALDEADNLVRQHYLKTRSTLIAMGRAPDEASRLAGIRIFDEPPGRYNLNTSRIVEASGSWDTTDGFANDYINKMGHGYGNGSWGEAMPEVFRLALSGVETVVHSSSTTLYGALDNDDMYMYMGGLSSAISSIDGAAPDMVIADTSAPGRPQMVSLDRYIGKEFRTRYTNPKWIKGMQAEGYAGARAMGAFVEYLWGWDAVHTQSVDDRMWQETFDVYIADKHGLDMQGFFESQSPFAKQNMAARMLETIRKGYWQAEAETRTALLETYLTSAQQHGIDCSATVCGNGRLMDYILTEAQLAGLPEALIENAQRQLEDALQKPIAVAAAELENFAAKNDWRAFEDRQIANAAIASDRSGELSGLVMEQQDRSLKAEASAPTPRPITALHTYAPPLAAFLALAGWLAWPALRRPG
ncbi:MAG: cobaltochelatase subunit CobN [Pseudomonadota bacterium]